MILPAYLICLRQPGAELPVDVLGTCNAKCVQMVAGREGLDPSKARVLETASQDEVTVQLTRVAA